MVDRIEHEHGYIDFQQVGELADIHDVHVSPQWRGKGYGNDLLACFLKKMKDRNVTDITLEVRVDNIAAIGLYQKFNFKEIHVRKNYYKDGCDALLMKKMMR